MTIIKVVESLVVYVIFIITVIYYVIMIRRLSKKIIEITGTDHINY